MYLVKRHKNIINKTIELNKILTPIDKYILSNAIFILDYNQLNINILCNNVI